MNKTKLGCILPQAVKYYLRNSYELVNYMLSQYEQDFE